ncbi:MAG: YqaE/Pmp3 family membrane protein [Chitinophagales bacterium]|nr:YqaE/Pmp3 family membrane protein [Chitinophagales bacterium]
MPAPIDPLILTASTEEVVTPLSIPQQTQIFNDAAKTDLKIGFNNDLPVAQPAAPEAQHLNRANNHDVTAHHGALQILKDKLKAAATTTNANNKVLYAIISIFIPPLGVALYEQGITSHFWIDLILTLLFFIPGLIYALILILG